MAQRTADEHLDAFRSIEWADSKTDRELLRQMRLEHQALWVQHYRPTHEVCDV